MDSSQSINTTNTVHKWKFMYALSKTNIYVALGALSLSLYTTKVVDIPVDYWLHAFIFVSTLFTYNIQRIIDQTKAQKGIKNRIKNIAPLNSKLTLISGLASLVLFLFLSKTTWIVIIPLSLISLFYVLETRKLPSLRSLPYLKVFIVSLVWSNFTVLLPIISNSETLQVNFDIVILILMYFFFVFGESLPFDIRDMKYDEASKLKTIPIQLGLRKSILLSYISFLISLAGIFYLAGSLQLNTSLPIAFASAVSFGLIVISKTKAKSTPFFYEILLESVLLLPYPFSLLFALYL